MEEEVDVVVGLDIGTTKVVAVVGYRDQATGKIRVLGYGKTESLGVVRATVINIQRTTEAIKRAIADASANSGVDIGEVYVGIAGQHIECFAKSSSYIRPDRELLVTREEIQAKKREISGSKVKDGKVILHVIPQTFTVDGIPGFHEEEFEGMTGTNIEVTYNVITADASAMRNIQRCVEDAGLTLKGFILEPLVSAEAVLDNIDKESGVVLVDIGGGTTDLAIFMNGILCHTAVIPLAGNVITSDIKQGCNILPSHAESLKVKFGSALPSEESEDRFVSITGPNGRTAREISLKNLAGIINARLTEIFESVAYEVSNCTSDLEKFIGGVVLTGGGSKMKYIDKECEFVTRLDTRLAAPGIHLTPESPKELDDPVFATAIGLVIYGIRCEEEEARTREPEPEPYEEPAPEEAGETPEPDTPPVESETKPRWWEKGFLSGRKIKEFITNAFDDKLE